MAQKFEATRVIEDAKALVLSGEKILKTAEPRADAATRGPRVFISYAWEDDGYKTRVRKLAERLKNDGLEVRLDQWHLEVGQDIVEFMSHEIRLARYVVVLCSPKFARKSMEVEEGRGPTGLVWEKRFITNIMQSDPKKVIPVLGRGTWETSAPSVLHGLLYVDLSSRTTFEQGYSDLCRRIVGATGQTDPLPPTPDPASGRGEPSRVPWPACRIVIACARSAASSENLRRIKKWFSDNPQYGADLRPTLFSLADAVESASGAATVLVALGFNSNEILAALPTGLTRTDLDIVTQPPSTPRDKPSTPSASLIGTMEAVSVAGVDPIPFVRKALLRLCARQAIRVRQIQTAQEFEEYFVLRYNVWKEMGYLPRDEGSLETPWDVNFTDRTSVALGAYERDRLVACVRLVYGLGEEDRSVVAIIERLLTDRGGTSLAMRLAIPPGMAPQFDILGAFQGFPKYYRRLVTDRVAKAEVSRVIVAPEYRKRGLGEVVVDSVTALANLRQLDLLFLACRQSHQSFYERCGFSAIPNMVCDRFINHDEPSIAMERHLGGTCAYQRAVVRVADAACANTRR
jgi:ribosomal protein S18 acetylase RimI-like enzyme